MASAAPASDPVSSVPAIFYDGSSPQELYFIAHFDNLASILARGILSNKRASRLQFKPVDISNQGVQKNRAKKIVHNVDRNEEHKRPLTVHQCANLYLRAHNSMLFIKIAEAMEKQTEHNLCVLRIDPRILRRKEVVVTTQNVARNEAEFRQPTKFRFSPTSSEMLRSSKYKEWEEKGTLNEEKRKGVQQAEVLIPYQLHPSYIRGIYVADETARKTLAAKLEVTQFDKKLPIDVHQSLFLTKANKCTLHSINPAPLRNEVYPELDEELPESSDEEDETPSTSSHPKAHQISLKGSDERFKGVATEIDTSTGEQKDSSLPMDALWPDEDAGGDSSLPMDTEPADE